MATKKATSKKNPGTSLALYKEQLAAKAKAAAAITGVAAGTAITTRAGVMKYQGQEVPGNKLNGVVVFHIFENAYYEGKFDANNLTSPICFAYGTVEAEMAPHADSSDPQHVNCRTCPHNQFQSADTGKGKACGNHRKLAIIPEDAAETADTIAAADMATFKTSPTSNKIYDAYVKQVAATLSVPPLGVITEIKVVPDADVQFKATFKVASEIEDGSLIEALFNKEEAAMTLLTVPYKPNDESAKPTRGKAPAKKTAGKPKFAKKR